MNEEMKHFNKTPEQQIAEDHPLIHALFESLGSLKKSQIDLLKDMIEMMRDPDPDNLSSSLSALLVFKGALEDFTSSNNASLKIISDLIARLSDDGELTGEQLIENLEKDEDYKDIKH